jgi:nicotinate-nucleotide adenylyltransferase
MTETQPHQQSATSDQLGKSELVMDTQPVTAWLFGTFNPIHNGHIAMAKAALGEEVPNIGKVVRVVLVPAAASPWKYTRPDMLAYEHRLAMCELAVEDLDNIQVSAIEGDLLANMNDGQPLTTWQVLETLHQQEQIPQWPSVMLAGTDTLLNLPKWANAESIMAHTLWLHAVRESLDSQTKLALDSRLHTIHLPMEPMAVSSSAIRSDNSENAQSSDALSPAVGQYLSNHGLL